MPGRRSGARRTARRTSRRTSRRTFRRRRRRRSILVGGAVLIGGGALVYKLSKQDAQKIEEHTGIPPDELDDEDLQAAMQELNIQSQNLTDEDRAAMAQDQAANPDPEETVAPAAAPAAAAGGTRGLHRAAQTVGRSQRRGHSLRRRVRGQEKTVTRPLRQSSEVFTSAAHPALLLRQDLGAAFLPPHR